MGFMTEKFEQEKEQVQKEQAQEQAEAIRAAVAAAVTPLQREIGSLRQEVRALKQAAVQPPREVFDDKIRSELRGFYAAASEGIQSYRVPVYALFGAVIILAGFSLWSTWRMNTVTDNLDWKYDVVTGVLSGDRAYWWDGANYEASRQAPEAKRLQNALDRYHQINEQIKRSGK